MQRSLYLLLFILLAGNGHAQSLKKYPLGKSGCYAYFLCNPGEFNADKSPDSSEVYTGECTKDSVSYGAICVKLKDTYDDMSVAENLLVMYLDFLKSSFKVTTAAGYGKGHRLKKKENTRGIVDYWKDEDGANWKVKGWTNGKYVSVMYVLTKGEVPEIKANAFLDSLVFPGM